MFKWYMIKWKAYQENGNGESDEPTYPDVTPMVLVAVYPGERVDQGHSEESKNKLKIDFVFC